MAKISPVTGDRMIAVAVLPRPVQTMALKPPLQMPAPTRPPISACEEEDGIPASQVTTFQTIAPMSAPKIT